MKKVLFLLTVSLSFLGAGAQSIESIKGALAINQFKKAKEDLDKAFTNTKFTSKPEAYMLKTAVYAALSMDESNKNTPTGQQLAADADAAFRKYQEMDPAMPLVTDLVYQNGPINLYSSYYSEGYADYSAKPPKWQSAYEKCKRAAELSDMLIAKKVFQTPMDTNVLVLAGITAENSGNKEDAYKFYKRLADANIAGEGFESVYRFLVSNSFAKKDMASFEKYKETGARLYPKSEYFKFDKVDFAVGLAEGFTEKLKAVEEVLATDPSNYKANEVMGELIYDTLNSTVDHPVMPANAAELEAKMVAGFNKAAAAKPGTENPYLYLGDHFINKAVKANDAREAFAKELKARTKPGTMASKEDVAKRDLLDKQYGDALLSAQDPYEKVAAIFAAKEKLELRDKQQYKKAVSYLADIAAYKKGQNKSKPTEFAKYEKEEKKWNDLYETIK